MGLEFAPGKTRIGWIGTGVMGSSMCGHLIDGRLPGDGLQPHSEKTKAAGRQGGRGRRFASPSVAAASDVVFTIVGFPSDVREVFLGADGVAGRVQGRARSSST